MAKQKEYCPKDRRPRIYRCDVEKQVRSDIKLQTVILFSFRFPWLCSLKEAGYLGRHRCGVTLISGETNVWPVQKRIWYIVLQNLNVSEDNPMPVQNTSF